MSKYDIHMTVSKIIAAPVVVMINDIQCSSIALISSSHVTSVNVKHIIHIWLLVYLA